MIERGAQLAKFHRLLNTDDGMELLADLKIAWGSAPIYNPGEPIMQGPAYGPAVVHNATLLEAFRLLESYQQAKELQR